MARRARQSRKTIPGYDEFRPSHEDRVRDHRRVRHAASQKLRTVEDAEDLTLPRVMSDHHHVPEDQEPAEAPRRRFDVGKTKFWKRRAAYRDMKASMDAAWPEPGSAAG